MLALVVVRVAVRHAQEIRAAHQVEAHGRNGRRAEEDVRQNIVVQFYENLTKDYQAKPELL
jgi:hypothetical protein